MQKENKTYPKGENKELGQDEKVLPIPISGSS